jgi:hypothetical protein
LAGIPAGLYQDNIPVIGIVYRRLDIIVIRGPIVINGKHYRLTGQSQ